MPPSRVRESENDLVERQRRAVRNTYPDMTDDEVDEKLRYYMELMDPDFDIFYPRAAGPLPGHPRYGTGR